MSTEELLMLDAFYNSAHEAPCAAVADIERRLWVHKYFGVVQPRAGEEGDVEGHAAQRDEKRPRGGRAAH